jgi:hypothetical protein
MKNGSGDLRGNNNRGKSYEEPSETGKGTKYGRTATGSGPDTWRHDGTSHGIADLVGNVWEWNDGLKLVAGKIIMPADNAFLLPESEWPDTGAVIDLPGSDIQISNEISQRDYDGSRFSDATVKNNYDPPLELKQALLQPLAETTLTGYFWADNTEDFEALPLRGGSYVNDDYAGLAALNLYVERGSGSFTVGFRPAFID